MHVLTRGRLTLAALLLSVPSAPLLGAELAARLPPGISLEQPAPEAGQTKIVFVAGSNDFKPGQHEYVGGCAVLMDLVRQTPHVFPVLALDWPQKPATFAGAKSVVFFFDGGEKHGMLKDDHLAEMKKMADAGVGFVFLHQGIDVPLSQGDQVRAWMGAAFEKGYSQRAHWVAQFDTFPDHPICRGVSPFKIDDGWLYNLRFVRGMQGVTPLLKTVSPKASPGQQADDKAIVSWAFERAARGRSFTFTGCHLHASFAEAGYRRFLTNGILWTAGIDIPAGGAPVALAVDALGKYLEPRPAASQK